MSKNIPDRTFGVELELEGLSEEQAYLILRMADVPVDDPQRGRRRQRGNNWNIHYDSSIRAPSGRACEVVSAPMRGAEGLKEVRRVCTLLQKAGGSVNASCGLHVHVGARDLAVNEVIHVVKRYADNEEYIDSLVPPERRGNRSNWCASMKNLSEEFEFPEKHLERELTGLRDMMHQVDGRRSSGCGHYNWNLGTYCHSGLCPDCEASMRSWAQRIASLERGKSALDEGAAYFKSVTDMIDIVNSRYHKVNLWAYRKYGTLEFRQHNGCIDGHKVANWIRFVLNFVERSRLTAPPAKPVLPTAKGTTLRKYTKLIEALEAAGNAGLPIEEAAATGGWSLGGMNGVVHNVERNFGVQIRRDALGRYVLPQRLEDNRKRVRSVDNGPLTGLPSYIKAYFNDRANMQETAFRSYS